MNDEQIKLVLLMKYIHKETKEGREYLRACSTNKKLVKNNPQFWIDMYDESKLIE